MEKKENIIFTFSRGSWTQSTLNQTFNPSKESFMATTKEHNEKSKESGHEMKGSSNGKSSSGKSSRESIGDPKKQGECSKDSMKSKK